MQPDGKDIVYTNYLGIDFDFFVRIYELFGGSQTGFDGFMQMLTAVWTLYTIIAFSISALLIFGIVYSYIRLNEYSQMQTQNLLDQENLWKQMQGAHTENQRWHDVQMHLDSDNPNDWKLAIIEADVMLEHMLDDAGFAGNTIADRLRSASHRSFATLQDAWDAHRVRNQIAHGGSDFILTQKVARDTIIQYQKVFQEFGVV